MAYVIDVLRGSKKERLIELGHDRLSTYGIGADKSQDYWASLLRHLIHHGFLLQDVGDYSVLKLTASAWPLLRGETNLTMAEPRVRAEPRVKAKRASKRSRLKAGDIEHDHGLFERLRVLRKKLADEEGVPPFVIFSDVSLTQMASNLPATSEELHRIHGVGDYKLERYGTHFLDEIRRFLDSSGATGYDA
jgi:ATP-dependent DNA helicase RecQ